MSETDYGSFERYLETRGWKRQPAGTFSNGSVELVFDTSQYLEVYQSDGTRMAESRITCVAELEEFLIKHRLNS